MAARANRGHRSRLSFRMARIRCYNTPMPSEPDKASETDNPKRPQFTLKVVFISITLIGIGLGWAELRDGVDSEVFPIGLIGAGIGFPVGWLRKGNKEGAMQWALYGSGVAMLSFGVLHLLLLFSTF